MGLELGLPEEMIWRHPISRSGAGGPLPGPRFGAALGDPARGGLRSWSTSSASGLYRKVQQAFAVLLPIQSVGVMGDGRTYEDVIAVRAVETADFMTADWYPLPYEVLAAHLDADHQPGPRREPRRLRRQLQTSQHDRMGMSRRRR